VYDTQYKEQMYIYNKLNCLSGIFTKRVAGINKGSCYALKWHIAQSQGGSTPLRTEGSRDYQEREAGLVIRGQKSKNKLKEDYQARAHSYQMVLVIARQEASAC
jgi:hypothetical protein